MKKIYFYVHFRFYKFPPFYKFICKYANAASWHLLSGFIVYKQATEYYCVPASCKCALQYINGSYPSQDEIQTYIIAIQNTLWRQILTTNGWTAALPHAT